MQKKIFLAFIMVLMMFCKSNAQTDTIILNHYKQYLLSSTKPEGNIKQLRTSLNAAHQWPDINYSDIEKANWQNLQHLKRVRDLALVWANPQSADFHQPELWQAINSGLNHWLEKRYKNSNWWHNEIGVPAYMRDIIILLKAQLSPLQIKGAMEVMAQHRVQEQGVGANLTWSADLGFHYGVLTNNQELMRHTRDLILKEIKISTEEGLQPDFSFHQHGKRLQMYQYGRAFLWDNVRLAWELKGTEMAFPDEKIKILTDFVLNGWQWMARGIHTVPGTMDRSVSRSNALNNADIVELIPYLIELNPENKNAFNAIADKQKGEGALQGYRYFPHSDFAAYHQQTFSFFLKTISTRTLPSESINRENLKGKLLNSGDAYLIRDGNEYFNLMPVWNWDYLPGITAFDGADKIKRQPFTGSAGNEKAGLTVMDYQIENKDKSQLLSARKFWAANNKQVVCLIADLKGAGIKEAYTVLDQCRWRGDVTVNKVNNRLRAGSNELDQVFWIHHSGFAYIPLKPVSASLGLKTVTGSWQEINVSETKVPVTERIFTPVLHHVNLENPQSTGYVLIACKTPDEASTVAANPNWKVLKNEKECQAVLFNDGTLMAAFYSAGRLRTKTTNELYVDKPCLVLIKDGKIYMSNPACKAIRVNITLNSKTGSFKLPEDGSTKEVTL